MKVKLLFICLGNICRSPSAEAVMKALVNEKGITKNFFIDSAGTSGYHEGDMADSRMKKHASKRNYYLTSLSRPVDPYKDFEKFDMIIGMDDNNIADLKKLDINNKYSNKFFKITDFCTEFNNDKVPDPYYGGSQGFELVLDLLEDACEGCLKHISKKNKLY